MPGIAIAARETSYVPLKTLSLPSPALSVVRSLARSPCGSSSYYILRLQEGGDDNKLRVLCSAFVAIFYIVN